MGKKLNDRGADGDGIRNTTATVANRNNRSAGAVTAVLKSALNVLLKISGEFPTARPGSALTANEFI